METFTVTMHSGDIYREVPASDEWEARRTAIRLHVNAGRSASWVSACAPSLLTTITKREKM